ncbi:MAG: MATE family efflux transporter [Ruminococcaceae bacterium]|nr:MATE family efflux transporter [Oscillospiraceae bacterium]
MASKYSLDMTKGPFFKKILRFSLPLVLTGLLQMIYNTADVIVVGRFAGGTALAAVGATGSLVNLILNIFLGMSMGSGVMTAKYIGARDENSVKRCVHSAMLLSILSGIFVAIFGFLFSEELLVMMDSPEDVLPLSKLYLQIFFFGAPAGMVFNFGASIVRATGDTKKPLLILSLSGIVNIVLNLILVIKFNMSVAGVAIATIVSQYISATIIVIVLLNMKNACKLDIKKLRFHKEELKRILYVGIPAGIQNSLFSVSNVIIQTTVNSFGSVAMAGIAAGSNVDSFIYTCTNAISQTTMTFSSQNYGAKKYENFNKIYFRCVVLTIAIGGGMGALGVVFKDFLVGIFSTDPAVIEIGAQRLTLILPFYFFCSLMDVGAGQLRGMGKSFLPMIVSLLGGCGLRLLWIFVFFPKNPTLIYLYYAYPISWTITFVVLFVCYFIVRKQILKKR